MARSKGDQRRIEKVSEDTVEISLSHPLGMLMFLVREFNSTRRTMMDLLKRCLLLAGLLCASLIVPPLPGFAQVSVGGPGSAASDPPAFVQHVDINQFGQGGSNITSLLIRLPNLTLANNCVVVSIANSGPATVSSVTDDKGNTYTIAKSETDGGYLVSVYVAQGVTAGARLITVTFSGATDFISAKVTEFAGIATSGAVDATSGNIANSTTITAGSITPTQTGDLLYQVGFQDTGVAPAASSFTVGSQSNIAWAFVPGGVSIWDGSYAQYGQYNSTSAIDPTLTVNTPQNYLSVALALKAASAGTTPAPGIRVVAAQHIYLDSLSSNTVQSVTAGNLQILLSTSTDGISGVTSTNGTWQRRVAAQDSGDGAYGEVWDTVNASPGTRTLTVTFNGANNGHDIMLLDVAGSATSPFDTSAKLENQVQLSGTTLTTVSITPNTSNGLVVTAAPIELGEVTDLTTTGQYSLTGSTTPVDIDSWMDENNGYGIYYNPNTSPVQFVWNETRQVGFWAAAAASYEAAAGVSGTTYTVSGTITPTSLGNGVTVTLSQNGTAIATTTASNGSYSFTNVAPGTYTVTPNEPGINFVPTSQNVTVSGSPATVSTFTATAAATYTVSGTITPASLGNGATVTLSQNGTTIAATTVSNGSYSFTNVAPGTYTVTPTESGITFSPTSQGVTVSEGPATVSTFTATATYTVSGTITPASLGNGATVTLSQNGTIIAVTTAAGGRYSFTSVAPGTYTVTPSESGITFSPTSRSVTVSRGPVTVSTFRATALRGRFF